jgi:hypothetical protein
MLSQVHGRSVESLVAETEAQSIPMEGMLFEIGFDVSHTDNECRSSDIPIGFD